jgi:hypothetical protein
VRPLTFVPLIAGAALLLSACAPHQPVAISPRCKFLYTDHATGGGRWRADTLYRCGSDLVVRRDQEQATPGTSTTVASLKSPS